MFFVGGTFLASLSPRNFISQPLHEMCAPLPKVGPPGSEGRTPWCGTLFVNSLRIFIGHFFSINRSTFIVKSKVFLFLGGVFKHCYVN
jgi:hypothetical protein